VRASTYPLVEVDDAAALVLEHTPVLGIERVALAHCIGRVLAEDLAAPASLPAFPSSAVDGYAVRAADAGKPLRVLGESRDAIERLVGDALETVGLANKGAKYPRELSGGEQQRVAIARALVPGPRLIVADEPTGNLDPATAWEIMQLFLRINASGSTVVMATHNREIVDLLRRRVVAIEDGRIVRDDRSGTYHEDLATSALRA